MKTETEIAIELLKQLIATPSFSKEESATAEIIATFFDNEEIPFKRKANNVWVVNKNYVEGKPTILLNSHHDTVRPGKDWTKNPFEAKTESDIAGEKIFGLGSNDAGGALCSLLVAFLNFYQKEIPFNLIFAATAEEEISGKEGIESILPELGKIDFAIVGEPTHMQMAIAEKGLLVLDCISIGKTGHAARDGGENAIYLAMKDIEWFKSFQFPKISKLLGPVKMSVTTIVAGKQHNVIPAECLFTVDIRITEDYSHEDILEIIRENVKCKITPRSTRLRSSSIEEHHPIVEAGKKIGIKTFGSPTSSDQTLIPFPSIKIGPGDSERSHTADEFIYLHEIKEGIEIYIQLLDTFKQQLLNQKEKEIFQNHS